MRDLEVIACTPELVDFSHFNPRAILPYDCTVEHIAKAMQEFVDFLGFVNNQLYSKKTLRLESLLMPANFSSIVGEFIISTIPKHCVTLVKNRFHNGHPDLLPTGHFSNDAAQHASEGIEVKASRYGKGWQGHNAEDGWLMVFVFDTNSPRDPMLRIAPKPFRFVMVLAAQLYKDDWQFSGRSATSRRTITASVKESGYTKMIANWIYK